MTYISSSEVKNIYFVRGKDTNKKYFFASNDEINVIFMTKI